ncbi:hypothetical protein PTKU46_79890 [Paraburkholderia terrae]|uniref:DUF2231 domain-containing protein n=1 Tax=Paraburkholderia terrae TaxID=311230 RepID=UPI0030E04E74
MCTPVSICRHPIHLRERHSHRSDEAANHAVNATVDHPSALCAAVPGFIIDLLFYKGGAPPVRKIALTHMAINLTIVVLYANSIWRRTRSPTSMGPGMSTPVLLSIVGVALLFVSGWLGGQMVHVYEVGVEGRE